VANHRIPTTLKDKDVQQAFRCDVLPPPWRNFIGLLLGGGEVLIILHFAQNVTLQ
jgi:hypothetical protein